MAARAIGSGTISFGLVSIPVKLYTAASAAGVSFNLLHAKCGSRLKQQYICPVDDNEVVPRDAMAKGYEYQKDQYVTFTEDELKKLESERTGQLELIEFVPEKTVDFVYIEKTYYLGPDKGGDRAYRLLSEAMQSTGRIAVGKYWTRGKEQLVLVRPYRDGLALHEVYYANEVRSFDEVETGGQFQFKDVERELAEKLIAELSVETFRADKYNDEYVTRVVQAVEQKVAGQEVVLPPEAPKAQIIDLLEALKRSVADVKKPGVAKASESTAEAAADAKPAAPPAKGPKKAGAGGGESAKKKAAG